MRNAGNGDIGGMKTGKIPESVLKRSVLRQLKTERKEVLNGAGIGEDCAIFSFSGQPIVSCMQEAVVRRKADAGIAAESKKHVGAVVKRKADAETAGQEVEPRVTMAHLIQRCVNNLAAAGAQPVAVMITLLLPQACEELELKAFMGEAEEICGKFSVSIAGGQTRVSGEIKSPIAVVTGFGELEHTSKAAAPGQDVIVSKWIGLEGTAMLAHRYRDGLLSRYPAYLVDEAIRFDRYLSVLPEAAAAAAAGVCAMHDASAGGIFAALWELAERAGVGLTIDMRKLPLRQETVEVCEYFKVNPYELLSGGSLVMTAEDGPGLVAALNEKQIPAVIVGKVTDSNDRLLLNGDEVRYMDRPKTDELYRIFQVP